MKRAISLIVALAMLLVLAPTAFADSPAYGSDVWLKDTKLQSGVVLSDNAFWSDSYSKPRHEYFITYSPGGGEPETPFDPALAGTNTGDSQDSNDTDDTHDTSRPSDDFDFYIPDWLQTDSRNGTASIISYSAADGVRPAVAFGSSVCDRLTAAAAAKYYEGIGYRVLGAINGDFYDVSTGFPLGLLISNGQLLSGSSEYYAVGFREDGTVVMGEPKLSITAKSEAGASTVLWGINKPRVDKGGVTMITYYYRNDHKTATASAGVNVLARIVGGAASIGSELTLQVEQVVEEAKSYTLEENQVLLSAAANGYADALGFLRSLAPGQTVTVSFSTPDPSWNDVTEAIGALYLLVSDGVAQTGFEVSAAPRTAVGVKANGDLVLYTIDGRQNTHSMGASLGVLAKRMAELGCVTALCLDGGGSTTMIASTPDQTVSRTINSPSDVSLRQVTNHIVLLAPGGATGQPGAVNLSAGAPAVLAGHTVKLTANLADTHYYPMGGDIQFMASAGTVQGDVFTAPETGGTVTVTAYSGTLSDQVDIQVLDVPQYVAIQRNNASITSLKMQPNETVQLGLTGSYNHRNLEIFASDYTWTVDPSLGTIDENGLLTAANAEGSGTITATRGSSTVSIPLTVKTESPFVDTDGHWAEKYMIDLYLQGILTGVTYNGKLYAYPDKGVTRAEFSVLLARYIGLDTAEYEGVETPFPDIESVSSWAGGAIRAMYSMEIVNGTTKNGQVVFDPQGTLTRAQAVTMLGRLLAQDADETDPLPRMTLESFTDAGEIPSYALEHFEVLTAISAIDATDGKLDPNGTMTRAVICKALDVLAESY